MSDTNKTETKKKCSKIVTAIVGVIALAFAIFFVLKEDPCFPDPEPEPVPCKGSKCHALQGTTTGAIDGETTTGKEPESNAVTSE